MLVYKSHCIFSSNSILALYCKFISFQIDENCVRMRILVSLIGQTYIVDCDDDEMTEESPNITRDNLLLKITYCAHSKLLEKLR